MVIALTNADTYVLDWNYMSMALRGAAIFIPMTLAIFWAHHLTASWAVLSMAASTTFAVFGRFGLGLSINPLFVGLSVSLLIISLGLIVSMVHNGWVASHGGPI
jgi:SSS family solute:Na+ symporter